MRKGKTYNREFQVPISRLVVEQGYTLKEASDTKRPLSQIGIKPKKRR